MSWENMKSRDSNRSVTANTIASKHIRFDDDDDDDDDADDDEFKVIKVLRPAVALASQQTVKTLEHFERKSLNLVKNRANKEDSFGFELRGDSKKSGDHFVQSVQPNSAAARANMKPNDKIVCVNGVNVENYSINSLFDLLEYETELNEIKLNVVVLRNTESFSSSSTSSYLNASKRSLDSNDENSNNENQMSKKKQNKSKNLSSINLEGFLPATELENIFNAPKSVPLINLTGDDDDDDDGRKNYNRNEHLNAEQIRQEKIEQIRFLAPQRAFKQHQVPSKIILNSKAKEIQMKLSEQGKYVSWQEIIYELLESYPGCQHIGDLGVAQADHLESISELLRLQRRIDTFIITYESRVPLITILDLEKLICNDFNYNLEKMNLKSNRISKFEELFLGPLIKNQLVRRIFHIEDQIKSVKQLKLVHSSETLKALVSYLQENDLWGQKIKQAEFEAHLCEKYSVKSAYSLGIKISNIGMLVGSLKTVQHLYAETLKLTRQSIDEESKEMLNNEKLWLLKQLNEKFEFYNRQFLQINSTSAAPSELKFQIDSGLSYLKMSSADVISDLLGLYKKLYEKSEFQTVKQFLNSLQQNVFLRDSFQLGLCLGKHDLFECLTQIESNLNRAYFHGNYAAQIRQVIEKLFFLMIHSRTKREIKKFLGRNLRDHNLKVVALNHKEFDDDGQEIIEKNDFILIEDLDESTHQSKNCLNSEHSQENSNKKSITDSGLNELLKNFVLKKLEPNSILTYEHLIKLEQAVFGDYCVNLFELLYKNRFLFEQNNLKIVLNDQNAAINSQNKVLKSNIIDHIARLSAYCDPGKLKNYICSYYSVKSFEDLGIGAFETLASEKNRQQKHDLVYIDSFALSSSNTVENSQSTDLNSIIKLIDECPLLENISSCLEWKEKGLSLVFGDLKQFLLKLNERNIVLGNNREPFSVQILETEPNALLKLTKNTNIDLLKKSIEDGDFRNSSGHLVSLISLKYRSVNQIPHALLSNEIQSAFSNLLNRLKCNMNDTQICSFFQELNTKHELLSFEFLTFIIEFICKIPFKLAEFILFKYILDPLIILLNDRQIKEKLFQFMAIKTLVYYNFNLSYASNDQKIKYLINLGKICSINEWSESNLRHITFTLINAKNVSKSYQVESIELSKQIEDKIAESVERDEPEIKNKEEASFKIVPDEKKTSLVARSQYEHVQSIRKRYGIGIELNNESKKVTDSLKGVIGRSLESLSYELYNKDMHFVLELIQNADDNNYPPLSSNIEPTLIFLIENNTITLFNNEIGFSDKNINAICDVKASTKGKQQRGYIGRKGIGFKSVFTVTDRPEIHSNGYHIQFNLSKNGHIGYILPDWIEDPQKITLIEQMNTSIRERVNLNGKFNVKIGQELNTCIHLPLKSESEMQQHKSSLLTNNFSDIKPYLLLFLNRLRNLAIISKNEKKNELNEIIYHREDLSENLVEIKSNNAEINDQKWLVMRECLKVPANLKTNDFVESTDLCFAFPYDSDPSKMDVFAYLPLRTFGFRFIIQADFVVPASRQDLNQDSDWNQWLISQIPSLFLKALHLFKCHDLFKNRTNIFAGLEAFMRFVPIEEEIVGMFQHIPRQINDLLRNEAFLPAIEEFDTNNEPILSYRKPFECVLTRDDLLKQVLSADLLKKYLGRYYLHSDIANSCDLKLLASLGVHTLNLSDLIEIVKKVFSQNMEHNNDLKLTAKWLVVLQHCLQYSMDSLQQEEKFLKQLKNLPFIPIRYFDYKANKFNAKMVSLNNHTIFLPLSSEILEQKRDDFAAKMLKLIEKDLFLLDTESLFCLDDLKNAQILALMKTLGIKQIESNELIENQILKVFCDQSMLSDRLDSDANEILIYYMIFLNENFNYVQFNVQKLRDILVFKTNVGFKKLKSFEKLAPNSTETEIIYLTPEYGNKYDLKSMFSSYTNWCFIDSCYLKKTIELKSDKTNKQKGSNEQVMLSWRKFFVALGLQDIFRPVASIEVLKQLDYENAHQIKENQSYVVKNYECHVTKFYFDLIEKQTSPGFKTELTNLFRLIEENWQNSSFLPKPLNSFKYSSIYSINDAEKNSIDLCNLKPIKENIAESFYFAGLKTRKWIPVEQHSYKFNSMNKNADLHTEFSLEFPSNVFIKEQVFLQLYGYNVSYAVNLPFYKDKNAFSREIGFRFEFSIFEFLCDFQQWTSSSSNSSTGMFFATLSQMKSIYLLLSNQMNSYNLNQEIYDLILSIINPKNSFIFVPYENEPDLSANRMDIPRVGRFYSPLNVYWEDSISLYTKYKSTDLNNIPVFLKDYYYDNSNSNKSEQLKQVFVDQFRVRQRPNTLEYVDLLEHISLINIMNKTPFSYEETIENVFRIFEILADTVPFEKEILLDLIKTKKVFPCYGKKWCSLGSMSNRPILVDASYELAEKFNEKLNFLVSNPQIAGKSGDFFDLCCKTDALSDKMRFFFFDLLKISTFSSVTVLDLENITESLRESAEVQNLCRRLVPFMQSFLFSKRELRPLYDQLASERINMSKNLLKMKFYSVKELQNIYRFRHDPSIFICVSNKTCTDTSEKSAYWKYFVRADILSNKKDMIRGFIKLFTQNNLIQASYEKYEKELQSFASLINEFNESKSIKLEDRLEIEKDYNIKLNLPDCEPKWEINEAFLVTNTLHSEKTSLKPIENKSLCQHKLNEPANNEMLSKRQKLLIYDQLSSNQINLPNSHPTNCQSKPIMIQKPPKTLEMLDLSLSSLATTPTSSLQKFGQTHFDENASKYLIENHSSLAFSDSAAFSESTLSSLNALRETLQKENELNSSNSIDKEFLLSIGRWGELWVHELLKNQYRNEIFEKQVILEWMNEKNESGLPYDFRLTFASNSNQNLENVKFIEVKSTTKENKEAFPISYQELFFAQKYSPKFEIYRVYNAGNSNPNSACVKVIRDIPALLNSHGINLFIVI